MEEHKPYGSIYKEQQRHIKELQERANCTQNPRPWDSEVSIDELIRFLLSIKKGASVYGKSPPVTAMVEISIHEWIHNVFQHGENSPDLEFWRRPEHRDYINDVSLLKGIIDIKPHPNKFMQILGKVRKRIMGG